MQPSEIPVFPAGAARKAGTWDNARRWYPKEEYKVPGSFQVRAPSRSFPRSYHEHFRTNKYRMLLAQHRPDLYFQVSGVDPDSETGKAIIAWAVYSRMHNDH